MARIVFRPITEADFRMLHDWLSRPHVSEWWAPTPGLADVEREFGEMIDPASTTRTYVALCGGEPIGYIQSYVAMGSGDGWWESEQDPGVRGVDQFLADAGRLGHGLGTRMVRAFVEMLFTDPAVTRIQADPAPENTRAIRCYEKAGFRSTGVVGTPDGPALLMVCERPRPA